jgi:diphthamide synthase (EF-2-diphthine--ammonia ligase)
MTDDRLAEIGELSGKVCVGDFDSYTVTVGDLVSEIQKLRAKQDACRCGHGPSCPMWGGLRQVAWKS